MKARWTVLSCAAALILASVTGLGEALVPGWPSSGSPDGVTRYDLWETALALALSFAVVGAVWRDGAGVPRTLTDEDLPLPPVLWGYGLAVAAAALFVVSPAGFSRLAREDQLVETASALLCFVGSAMLAGLALDGRWAAGAGPRRRSGALAALGSFALFLVGMEEISWMQRILGFQTPASFSANIQDEANLHNFATGLTETIYIAGAWAALVLLPFATSFGPKTSLLGVLHPFSPPRWVTAMAAPFACFNYDAWPLLPIQIVTVSTVVILLVYATVARREGHRANALLYALGAVLIVAVQLLFLLEGGRLLRPWDPTEYQELFMPLGFAALAWTARRRLRVTRP